MKLGDVLYVVWTDAYFIHGWDVPEDLDFDDAVIHSVGFLLEDSKKRIVIAMSKDEEEAADYLVIPRVWVKSTKVLKRSSHGG